MSGARRDFTRSPVEVQADVTVGGRTVAAGPTDNLSLKGLYIRAHTRPPVNARCEVVLWVGGRDAGPRVRVNGHVARLDEDGIGVEFEEIVGTESYHHLQQLVLWNSPTPGLTEDEFHQHLGIKPIGS